MPAAPDEKTPRTNHFNRLYYSISVVKEVRVNGKRHKKRVYRITLLDEKPFSGSEGLCADEPPRPLTERSRDLRAKAKDVYGFHFRQRPAMQQ